MNGIVIPDTVRPPPTIAAMTQTAPRSISVVMKLASGPEGAHPERAPQGDGTTPPARPDRCNGFVPNSEHDPRTARPAHDLEPLARTRREPRDERNTAAGRCPSCTLTHQSDAG